MAARGGRRLVHLRSFEAAVGRHRIRSFEAGGLRRLVARLKACMALLSSHYVMHQ